MRLASVILLAVFCPLIAAMMYAGLGAVGARVSGGKGEGARVVAACKVAFLVGVAGLGLLLVRM